MSYVVHKDILAGHNSNILNFLYPTGFRQVSTTFHDCLHSCILLYILHLYECYYRFKSSNSLVC